MFRYDMVGARILENFVSELVNVHRGQRCSHELMELHISYISTALTQDVDVNHVHIIASFNGLQTT